MCVSVTVCSMFGLEMNLEQLGKVGCAAARMTGRGGSNRGRRSSPMSRVVSE